MLRIIHNLLLIAIVLLSSCTKNYSLEYFNQYNPDAPNKVMSLSIDFDKEKSIEVKKYSYDIFVVTLYYYTSKGLVDTSCGQFNHNGKLLYFEQL